MAIHVGRKDRTECGAHQIKEVHLHNSCCDFMACSTCYDICQVNFDSICIGYILDCNSFSKVGSNDGDDGYENRENKGVCQFPTEQSVKTHVAQSHMIVCSFCACLASTCLS